VAGIKDIPSVWNNIKEIDLKPIRESAVLLLRIALVGAHGVGKHTLAEQMRSDPSKPEVHTQSAAVITEVGGDTQAPEADLIILLVDATRSDFTDEKELTKKWSEGGKNFLVFVNKLDLAGGSISEEARQGWMTDRVIYGSANQSESLQKIFVPAAIELLPHHLIALGRQFPLFRMAIARQLINETCFSNAAYSFSTGVAEIVPVLDLPLNLTDIVVLTKSQAFLAYKLGLLLGFSTRWQDYVTEFGGVIGGGFIWRQIARSLIGFVPGWGIIPKVAIAYSGTYVVGNAILGWYESGRNLSPQQMRDLSKQAFTRGKELARTLGERLPIPRGGKHNQKQISAGQDNQVYLSDEFEPSDRVIGRSTYSTTSIPGETIIEKQPGSLSEVLTQAQANKANSNPIVLPGVRNVLNNRISRRNRNLNKSIENTAQVLNEHVCSNCGKVSSGDAIFCQYCGIPF